MTALNFFIISAILKTLAIRSYEENYGINLLVVVNISEKPFNNLFSVPEIYINVVLKVRWVLLIC